MNHRTVILTAMGVAGLVFVATACFEARAAAGNETLLARLATQRADLNRELAHSHERIVAAETEQRRLQAMVARRPTVHPTEQPTRTKVVVLDPKTAAAAEVIARTRWKDVVLEKDPALQARYLAVRRGEFGTAYGPFLVEAGLSPAQAEKFKEIKVTAAESAMDLNSTMRADGLAETDPAVQALHNQTEEAMRAAERTLLGEEGYQHLVEFERAMPAREFVSGLAASLVFSGDPVSATQADQLTRLVAEASETYRNGTQATSPSPNLDEPLRTRQPAHEPIDSERVLAQARKILSPAQYAAFEAEILRTRTIVELFNVIRQGPGDPIEGFTIVGRN